MFGFQFELRYFVDFVIIAFTVFFIWDNWGKGMLLNSVEFLIIFLAFIASLVTYPIIAQLLMEYIAFPYGLANCISLFLLVVVFQEIFVTASAFITEKIPDKWPWSKAYNVFSFLPLLGQCLVVAALLVNIFLSLPLSTKLQEAIGDSTIGQKLYLGTQNLEKRLSLNFLATSGNSLHFITLNLNLPGNTPLNFKIEQPQTDIHSETEFITYIQKERQLHNLGSLAVDASLANYAKDYGQILITQGWLSYTDLAGRNSSLRKVDQGLVFNKEREIIIFAQNTRIAFAGIENIPEINNELLSLAYSKIGVGVVDAGIYGKLFVIELTD